VGAVTVAGIAPKKAQAAEKEKSHVARLGSNQQPLPSEFYQYEISFYKSMPYTTRKPQNQGKTRLARANPSQSSCNLAAVSSDM
jgi:hypothetical protein